MFEDDKSCCCGWRASASLSAPSRAQQCSAAAAQGCSAAFQAATQAEPVQLGSRSSTRHHHYSRSVAAAEPERVRMRLSTASDQQRRTSSSAGRQRRQTGSTGNEQTGPSSTSKVNQENNQPEESWLTRVCECVSVCVLCSFNVE